MENTQLKVFLFRALVLLSVILISCDKNQLPDEIKDKAVTDNNPAPPLKAAAIDHPGRYLAANCFQCHGTNGYAGELKIAGESSSEIIGELNEMKSKPAGENIMNVHARAYTNDEVKLIADFFSKQ